jgi:hypothetical protein
MRAGKVEAFEELPPPPIRLAHRARPFETEHVERDESDRDPEIASVNAISSPSNTPRTGNPSSSGRRAVMFHRLRLSTRNPYSVRSMARKPSHFGS